jgi:AcrR family transcriptional regulator
MSSGEPRARSGERREEILAVATRLFTQHGRAHVTTRQIAKAVGISQPSLYAHFRSADEIGELLCIRALEELHGRFAQVLAEPGSAMERLNRLGRAYVDFGLEQSDAYRIAFMVEEGHKVDDASHAHPGLEAGLRAFGALRQVVVELRGCDDEDTAACAQSIWASIHGLVSLLLARPHFPWVEQQRLIDIHLGRVHAMFIS